MGDVREVLPYSVGSVSGEEDTRVGREENWGREDVTYSLRNVSEGQ